MKSASRRAPLSSVFAIAVSIVMPAMAYAQQEEGERRTSPDDIVVTAQFRSQNLQDTPLAITAMNAEGLEARSASRVADIAESAPGVVIKPASSSFGPAAQIYIRGVGQNDSSFAGEPGVGTYIDDVYYGTLYGANFDLLDLDRVEVLRGPQGTLAGKNSIGGALKLFTRKPDGNDPGFIEASYGLRGLLSFRGGADFTLMPDTLFARVSGVYTRQSGYVQRYDYGCLNPTSGIPAAGIDPDCKLGKEGGKNYGGGRLALRYVPNDDVEVNLSATIVRDTSETVPMILSATTAAANQFFAPYNPNLFVVPYGSYHNYSTYSSQPFTDPAQYIGKPGAGSHPGITVPSHINLNNQSYTGSLDWTITDGLQLKAITGYTSMKVVYGTDVDVSPIGSQTALFRARSKQFSQEIRLSGAAFDDLLDWTIGGYYYHADNNFSGSNILYPGKPFQNLNGPDDDITSKNKSAFAQIIVHPLDRLNVTGGIRYTNDSKDYIYRRYNPFMPGEPTYTSAGILTGVTSDYEANKVDYRVSMDYRWSDELMTYAQISTGFRGGGTNSRPFVPEQAVPFYPETMTAYEIGFKSDLLDRRLRVNGSFFINDYQDIIFTNLSPTPNSQNNATPTNVGTAKFKGAELEITARPVDGLLIDASASYLDFQLKSFTATGVTIAGVTLDNKAPFVSKWKFAAGIQYAAGTSFGTITPRLDYNYQSSFYTNINNDPLSMVPGRGIFNARLTFDSLDKDWRLSVAVKNLFDKYYYNNKFFNVGLSSAQPAPPREISVTLRRNF